MIMDEAMVSNWTKARPVVKIFQNSLRECEENYRKLEGG
jgi:hypothetical protein